MLFNFVLFISSWPLIPDGGGASRVWKPFLRRNDSGCCGKSRLQRIWSEDLNSGQEYFGIRVNNPLFELGRLPIRDENYSRCSGDFRNGTAGPCKAVRSVLADVADEGGAEASDARAASVPHTWIDNTQ